MQGSNLYVGNLSYSVTESQLKELFSNHGEVKELRIISGKGFGFVEMSDTTSAQKAQEALNGSEFEGRNLTVNEARPKRESNYSRSDHGDRRTRF